MLLVHGRVVVREARVSRGQAGGFPDAGSVWGDLLLVRQVLHHRSQVPDEARNVFVKRALWEQAVVAYGRCFRDDRRQGLSRNLVDELGAESRRTHDEVMAWRDKHVAHRVSREHESVTTWIVFDDDAPRARSVRLRISTSMGPGDDLSRRLEELSDALMKRVWEAKFPAFEKELVELFDGDVSRWRRSESRPDDSSSSRLIITIDPTGGPATE